MARECFLLYGSFEDPLMNLSVESRGWLITAIFRYHNTGEIMDLPIDARMAFLFIKKQMDMDSEKYKKICQKRAESGRSGAIAANASKCRKQPTKSASANKVSKCQHNENENEYENENDVVVVTTTAPVQQQQKPKVRKFYIKGKSDTECRQLLRFAWDFPDDKLQNYADNSQCEDDREVAAYVLLARKHGWTLEQGLGES